MCPPLCVGYHDCGEANGSLDKIVEYDRGGERYLFQDEEKEQRLYHAAYAGVKANFEGEWTITKRNRCQKLH